MVIKFYLEILEINLDHEGYGMAYGAYRAESANT